MDQSGMTAVSTPGGGFDRREFELFESGVAHDTDVSADINAWQWDRYLDLRRLD
jgi:hypothetical protein